MYLLCLVLAVVFLCALVRVVVWRSTALQSIPLVTSIIGMIAGWLLGHTAATSARASDSTRHLFSVYIPCGGVALLVMAFASGVVPETNYWTAAGKLTGATEGVAHRFALSEDVLKLLTYQVTAIPFALAIPQRGVKILSLAGAAVAMMVLVLNGSMTYPMSALVILSLCFILLWSSHRPDLRPRVMPLVIAVAFGIAAAGITIALRPALGTPLALSLTNKDVTQGNNALDGRDVMWAKAVRHIEDNPVFGHALDEPTNEETRFAYTNPHNDYLLAALKFGVPAALLLVILVLLVGREFARHVLSPRNLNVLSTALLGLSCWLSLFIPPFFSGLLSSPFYSNLALSGVAGLCYTTLRLEGAV